MLLLLAAIAVAAIWAGLPSFDVASLRLEQRADGCGGQLKRATKNQGWFAWLPHGQLTPWLRPVVEIDFSDCNIDDEQMYWICQNGYNLEKIDISNNPRVTNKSLEHINQLASLQSINIDGTSIDPKLVVLAPNKAFPASFYNSVVFYGFFFGTLIFFGVVVLTQNDEIADEVKTDSQRINPLDEFPV